MVAPYILLLSLLAAERLVEIVISRRHISWALARGGVELGRMHFKLMKVLHTLFLFSCAAEVLLLHRPFVPRLGIPMLFLALIAQVIRYWAVFALGRHWNVRVVVVPGASPVTSGPYRYVRHPNYLAVVIEGFAVPLIHTAWITAIGFTLLNAVLLNRRIRCEEKALEDHCGYRERFSELPRFIPRFNRP